MSPTPDELKAFLAEIDTFLLDCDGVLWQGSQLISGIKDTLSYLRSLGKKLIFVTNNSTKSRAAYAQKFFDLGLEAKPEEIFGSAFATAYYLKNTAHIPADKKVYIVGQKGIADELDNVGIKWAGAHAPQEHYSMDDWDKIQPDPEVAAVVCGLDTDITYTKLAKAHIYLSDPGCLFIATNEDATFPSHGRLFPGSGSLLACVKNSTGRTPLIMGKPRDAMMQCLREYAHFDPKRTCMVGDRVDTDMLFGQRAGVKTALVLSGVTRRDQLDDALKCLSGANPTIILPSFATFLDTKNK